ncbi:MAG: helix-turn-helix domain-containing protein [Acidithiobacillus sp.]
MNGNVSFQALLKKAKQGTAFWISRAKERFTEDLFVLMKADGVSKSELAARLGTSPAYVTKILRGQSNFTIESMVVLARALDAEVDIRMKKARRVTLVPGIVNGAAYIDVQSSRGLATFVNANNRPGKILNPERVVLQDHIVEQAA